MATIEELERKIQRLERQLLQETEKTNLMIRKSGEALEVALHAYRIDHAGYVWVWNKETNKYNKTDVCVKVIIPKVGPKEITNCKIADKAVNNRTLDDKAVDARVLGDNAVLARHIHDKAVTPTKVSDNFVDQVVNPSVDVLRQRHEADIRSLMAKDRDLQNQLNLLLSSGSEYGNAREFRKIWLKLSEMTGEDYSDGQYALRLEVTPKYFIGENGCTVDITATTEGLDTVFEHIAFYIDDKLIVQHDNTDYMQYETVITKTSVVKCIATILGETYTEWRTIKHYDSFWMGAGVNYKAVMKNKNLVSLENGWRLAHDVTVGDNQHIVIIMGESLREGFIRADINGIEVEFDEERVAINGDYYAVLTSKNTYSAGTYNIDING